jgi:hypothetical protein
MQTFSSKLKQKRFPHWLSAWWIAILLAVGWGPLALDDLLQHFFPSLNANYQGSAFAMAWGLTATLLCSGLAAACLLIQIGRIVIILVIRTKF